MCSAGKYNMIPGCKACSSTSDEDCELCALGTYSVAVGRSSVCDTCVFGKYSYPASTKGATECRTCADGKFSLAGAWN